MKIAYGPPGATGVKHLQFLGHAADGLGEDASWIHRAAKPVGIAATTVWLVAHCANIRWLRHASLAVAVIAFFGPALARKP